MAAFIAATLGFGILSGTVSWIPRVLFVVFMVLFAMSLTRVGVLLWLVNTSIPTDGKIKKILNIAVVVVVVLWLLNVFGLWGHLHDVGASNQTSFLGASGVVSPSVNPQAMNLAMR